MRFYQHRSLLLSWLWLLIGCAVAPPPTVMPPPASPPAETRVPTATPEPIIPTATPPAATKAAQLIDPTPTATVHVVTPTPRGELETSETDFVRFGISGWGDAPSKAYAADMQFSQFLNWDIHADPQLPDEVTHWKMVRASNDPAKAIDWAAIETIVGTTPGAIWIIGNEMDVKWQDNVSAETYAAIYHDAYTRLKTLDPTSRVAFGGISQATPLRLAYLDRVLASYTAAYGVPLPADLFTVHAYVLREERDSWGVDIPPAMDDVNSGERYEIDDHASLELFLAQLTNFRRWMADNGYRDKPLAVTEFGILLPTDYGFPPEAVAQYMRDTIRLMLMTTDAKIGMRADGDRLVQTWFWYVVEDTPDRYPTSNLYDSELSQLTLLGETWRDLVIQLGQ